MLNFDRSTVKPALQNTQNYCHQSGFLAALDCTKFVFGRPDAPSTCRLPAKNRDQLRNLTLGTRVWATFYLFRPPIAGLRGNLFPRKRVGRVGRGGERERPAPCNANSWIRPSEPNSCVNSCIGIHVFRTNRAPTGLVSLQPVKP